MYHALSQSCAIQGEKIQQALETISTMMIEMGVDQSV
jgi:hypothetical protein